MKAINTISVVLIICGKINHQQKNTFIICKQLNGLVLKSIKPSCLDRNWKKNCLGWARAKIFNFVPGRVGLGPKLQFPFQTMPGLDLNFNFSLGQGQAEIFFFISGWAGSEKTGGTIGVQFNVLYIFQLEKIFMHTGI